MKVSGTFKEYYELLNKRLNYLHKLLLDFKSKKASYDKQKQMISSNTIVEIWFI